MNILTVSQLNRYVRSVLEEDAKLRALYVKGEIVNFTRNLRSGHMYFTLADVNGAQSSIRAVCFNSEAASLRFEPENGMAVLVQARVGLYERDGSYQLYVTDMQPDGAGENALALERIRRRLAERGLFDEGHKKRLLEFPGRIGVVTSETGAALRDIANVLSRRNPLCTLVLAAAQVQGAGAAESMISALKALDRRGNCGVIIIGRGGGSSEDLSAFNDEKLVQAVFDAKTPVISAVGHEVDYTLCDFAADLRAATPSSAVTHATIEIDELRRRIRLRGEALSGEITRTLRESQQRLDFFAETLYNNKRAYFDRCRTEQRRRAALLESLSPVKILARGYCLTYDENNGNKAVLDAAELKTGGRIGIKYRDGAASAEILEVRL